MAQWYCPDCECECDDVDYDVSEPFGDDPGAIYRYCPNCGENNLEEL